MDLCVSLTTTATKNILNNIYVIPVQIPKYTYRQRHTYARTLAQKNGQEPSNKAMTTIGFTTCWKSYAFCKTKKKNHIFIPQRGCHSFVFKIQIKHK